MITTEDLFRHDQCNRLETWSLGFELPRIPLGEALNRSLRIGLLSGKPEKAYASLMEIAANPGLDVTARNVYDIAEHHACLLETVTTYLLGSEGPWKPAGAVTCGFDFQPLSYQMEDGRLRRVILCSSWSPLRETEERASWWTVGDTAATGRPMLINVIVIGQSVHGFRPSPWTQAFVHPENGILRIRRKPSEKTGPNPKFTDNWKKVYRENTDHKAIDWLGFMQKDDAFEGVVHYLTVEPWGDVLEDMARMAKEIGEGKTTMRRSACYRYAPCPMAGLCHAPKPLTPEGSNWARKKALR